MTAHLLALLLTAQATAGEGFAEGEEQRLTLECTKKRDGEACLALAGDTS